MICEHCHGIPSFPPCLSCGGCGIGHCCEGMVGGPYEEAAQSASSWGTTNPANWEESTIVLERVNIGESTT